jgi:hypothetical protein
VADSVVGVEVAGAYVRKAAYRLTESNSSALSIGRRRSREKRKPSRLDKRRRRSSSPLPKGAGRSPGPLRQQSHSEVRRVRRPPGRRAVGSSGPPSCSRSLSWLGFVMMPMVGDGKSKSCGRNRGLIRDQEYNSKFDLTNGATRLASRRRSTECYRHLAVSSSKYGPTCKLISTQAQIQASSNMHASTNVNIARIPR